VISSGNTLNCNHVSFNSRSIRFFKGNIMSHRVLADLLQAFSTNGPGLVPVTATATGARLPDDRWIQFVIPTWGAVDNILILPPATPGRIVVIAGAATGGEIRTTSPTTIGINGGTGAAAESAIAANMMVLLICESATNWKGTTIASNGTVTTLQVAAP
jgi:hypothetical protein